MPRRAENQSYSSFSGCYAFIVLQHKAEPRNNIVEKNIKSCRNVFFRDGINGGI
jgi:hypothetical protein